MIFIDKVILKSNN